MKILIFGGTRFIGLSVLKSCLLHGHSVTYLSRKRLSGLDNLKPIQGEREKVIAKLNGQHFDVIVDFTAYNSSAILNSLQTVKASKYILISTAWLTQYKDRSRSFSKIDAAYIRAKSDAEQCLKNWQDDSMSKIILRFPATFGSGDHSGRLDYLATKIYSGKPITICEDISTNLSFSYVRDVSDLILHMILSEQKMPTYIGDAIPDTKINYDELIHSIADLMEKNAIIRVESKRKIKNQFPLFFMVDPFWQEASYLSNQQNPFSDFSIQTTPYFHWLKECFYDYDPKNSTLSDKTRSYTWMSDEFLAAEKKWNQTLDY